MDKKLTKVSDERIEEVTGGVECSGPMRPFTKPDECPTFMESMEGSKETIGNTVWGGPVDVHESL